MNNEQQAFDEAAKLNLHATEEEKRPIDREWSEYPVGTKAHAIGGGYWIRIDRGWKWFNGSTFPRPGADACSVTLPTSASPEQTSRG